MLYEIGETNLETWDHFSMIVTRKIADQFNAVSFSSKQMIVGIAETWLGETHLHPSVGKNALNKQSHLD